MIVKYYGFGELPNPSNEGTYRNAVINVLQATDPTTAHRHLGRATPSACIMLVPGTFDENGRHVG